MDNLLRNGLAYYTSSPSSEGAPDKAPEFANSSPNDRFWAAMEREQKDFDALQLMPPTLRSWCVTTLGHPSTRFSTSTQRNLHLHHQSHQRALCRALILHMKLNLLIIMPSRSSMRPWALDHTQRRYRHSALSALRSRQLTSSAHHGYVQSGCGLR